MEIKRDAYLQQLIERKDNGMIKVITGIRRCGIMNDLTFIEIDNLVERDFFQHLRTIGI